MPPALTYGSSDERGGIANVVQALLLDEVGHGGRKALVMCLHVVLKDETAEGTSWLI